MIHKPFDLFAEFAKFGAQERLSLRDPDATLAFIAHAKDAVGRALADPAFIHGQRTEVMFEAMLVSLGDYSLRRCASKTSTATEPLPRC